MCGIVAYVGQKNCRDYVLNGLQKLEYRGYDSSGFACIDKNNNHIVFSKKVGRVQELKNSLDSLQYDGKVGIGHTRWATHGVANEENAHPHFNCKKNIALVHNGIVESYQEIRNDLISSGHDFYSSTDTEVVAHLLGTLITSHKTIKASLVNLVKKLKGAFAFAFLFEEYPDQLILIRHRSPLTIGVGDEEMFAASDPMAFHDRTDKVIFMPDESFAILQKDSIQLYDFSGNQIEINTQKLELEYSETDKKGFEHFMLKEIYEQKQAIDSSISFCKLIGSNSEFTNISDKKTPHYQMEVEYHNGIWNQLGISPQEILDLKKINLVAAGTSWNACRIAQFFFENICKIPTSVKLASEFLYMPFFKEENSLYIFVSQSGETADTLQSLRLANSFEVPTITITNVASSSMVRAANGFLLMKAGPEISVASTKAFSSQMSVLFWLANRIALEKELININQMKTAEEDLFVAAEVLEATIETYKWDITQTFAKIYSKYEKFIFLGRHISYPFALEAALKLKEISYIFAQCYPAGELKHGPIALIDQKIPVVLFSSNDELIYQKLIANAQEIKARDGHLVSFAFEDQTELINLSNNVFIIPKVNPFLGPLAMTGLMQFFVYQITKELGNPIDMPRNLAKSVTVE